MPNTRVTDDATRVPAVDLHDHRGEWVFDREIYPDPFLLSYASKAFDSNGHIVVVMNVGGIDEVAAVRKTLNVRMATDDEVKEAAEQSKRASFIRDLYAFAQLLERNPSLPIPRNGGLTMGYGLTRDDLDRISAAIGAPIEHQWNREFEVEFAPSGPAFNGGFTASWRATYPQCEHRDDPQDIPGLDEPFAARCVLWDGHERDHKPEQLSKAGASTKPAAS